MAGGGVKINNISVRGGANGKTPRFKIEDGNLYNTYQDGENPNWNNLGRVKGADGTNGRDGASGAKLVSQVLQGQDENGGNIYLQTFDDGTTAYFTAPKGDTGGSVVSVSATGTATEEVSYITIDGVEKKLSGSGGGGGGAVASVNGKTGVVVLDADDIDTVTNKRYVTDEQLAYLEEQTYAKPDIETFTLTPSETAYEIGSTVNITGFIHSETNVNNIEGNLSLAKNGTIVKSDITKSSIDTGVAYSDTFNINGIITYALQLTNTRGGTVSKTVTLSSYIPSYVGALTIGDITASDLGYLTKINRTSLNGNRSATISTSTGYVYFVSSQAITDIKDRDTGFGISYTQRGSINTTINGVSVTYYVYRTDELIQGTYNYVVS